MNIISRLTNLLVLVLLISTLSAQDTLLYQDFQDASFGQFQNIDNDGLALSSDFPGLMGAYNIIPVGGPSDYRAVAISSFENGGIADNWLITPQIEIASLQTFLSWSAASLSGDAVLLESYSVLVSAGGSDIQDFTISLLDVPAEEMSEQLREIDLSSFVGQSIFIAFNHKGTDNYALTLDNILVTAPSSDNSVELVKICGDRYQDLSQPDLAFQLVNTGTEIIKDLVVSVDINGDEDEAVFNDLNLSPQDTTYLSFAELYPFVADRYQVIANISSVNAVPVADQMDEGTFYMVANPPIKKLVLEEATSTSCGWCPEGIVQKAFMKLVYGDDVIMISAHSDDPMENTVYGLGLQNLSDFAGYPSGTLNRLSSVPHSQVDQYFMDDFSLVAPLELGLDYDYNSATRILNVNLNGTAHTSLSNDLHKFSLVILEDGVNGESLDFAQANNYSADASDIFLESVAGVNWQTLADPVAASDMLYDDVVRDVVGGFDGILGSISDAKNGENLSYDLEYTLSSAFDENNMWLIAMVIDSETGEVVNAVEKQMLFESGVLDNTYQGKINLYPNPAIEKIAISIDKAQSNVEVEVYDSFGKLVLQKASEEQVLDKVELTINDLEIGIYSVKISIGSEIIIKKLVVL